MLYDVCDTREQRNVDLTVFALLGENVYAYY